MHEIKICLKALNIKSFKALEHRKDTTRRLCKYGSENVIML